MKKYLRRLITASLMVGSLMCMPITHASVEAYNNRGYAYDDLKEYDKAIADQALGEVAKAQADFDKAKSLNG